MKNMAKAMIIILVCVILLPVGAQAARMLVPVGKVIGLELGDDTVTVAAFDDTCGTAAKDAGLCVGDKILTMDGNKIRSAEDVLQVLQRSDGRIQMVVNRGGKEKELEMQPVITKEGPRLGVYLRRGVTGIGTVTWYDPENGQFGTLGHGVNGTDGQLLSFRSGCVYEAQVISVKKGKIGQPGQLRGSVTSDVPVGTLYRNCPRGVFGHAQSAWQGQPLPVAKNGEVSTGKATILSTVVGDQVQAYSVEILKLYPDSREDGRNLMLRVTDPKLLDTTGGIVQGMSGSPIIQDGKLVGAVTHVLVNDPTRGYGIFIENMLEAAG